MYQGPQIPKKLAYHCAVTFGQSVYIHGGFEFPDIPNFQTFILHLPTKTWRVIDSEPDCGSPPPYATTTCTLWKNEYLIVPTFDIGTMKTCTAILSLNTEKWTKLNDDQRHLVVAGGIGKSQNDSELVYIGGFNYITKQILKTVYRMENIKDGWKFITIDVHRFSEVYTDGLRPITQIPNKDYNQHWHFSNKYTITKV